MQPELRHLLHNNDFDQLAERLGQRFGMPIDPTQLRKLCQSLQQSVLSNESTQGWSESSWESWSRNRLENGGFLAGTAASRPQPEESLNVLDTQLPNLGSGSPHYILEDTSLGQDNAIRALEGE